MVRFFATLPAVLGAICAIIGILGAAAWGAGTEGLTSLIPASPPMSPLASVCIVLSGIALIVARKTTRPFVWILRALAAMVAAICLTTLAEYALQNFKPLDLILLRLLGTDATGHETRHMGVNTAIAFVFLAQGMVFLPSDRRDRKLKSQFFATLSLIVAFVAVIGHMFGVKNFYNFTTLLSGMALSTAITLTMLGVGLLFSQLERGIPALIVDDGAAGFVARRLLPGVVVVPFILAMLRLAGEQRNMFDQRLGASLGSVANMVAFLLLIAWSARVLRETDAKRADLFRLEREARDAAERAREEAEAATLRVEAARSEAESANGAKSDFLAVMSHELRTPLAAIMGYQELLADGITGPITEAQAQQLGRIKASARHLLSLIDEILTFTRLDAGRETVVLDKFDVEGAMNQAVEIAEPLVTAKKLELKLIPPPSPVLIESDPTKVRQILVNLLSNAVKFTDTGAVTLEGRALKNEVQFVVSDTGIGIHPDNLNRIFDPFWQVEQKATRRATGTGLGLTVCRRLANLMGGDVAVTSEPGQGTTFTVTLPMTAPHIAAVVPVSTAHLRVG
ncbi:MAG TPA: HAMP domain-containing sensor histidine kinase [Gemmatimonadaceae bacterium]|nr:HAMP domain-containing sensor histidine kinase [Gemmatimonadaceae bacterium]